MKIIVDETVQKQTERVALAIAHYINSHPGALLCLAAGDTPLPVYEKLVQLDQKGKVDLRSVDYVGLDEWLGLGPETNGSCIQVMDSVFYRPAGIDARHKVVWNGLCEDPDKEVDHVIAWIRQHGHIGLTLLGVGMNGHIGFNEPGTGLMEGGIVVLLDSTTRRVAAKYFDHPVSVSCGLSIGTGELIKADEVLLMASGPHKADIMRQVLSGPVTASVPASLLTVHPRLSVYLDQAAAVLSPTNPSTPVMESQE